MPSIKNTTHRPLAVSLPGNKKLRLGPLQTGQVTPKALEHPPLVAQVEAGVLEVTNGSRPKGAGRAPGSGGRPPQGRSTSGNGGFQSQGDR